MKRVTSQIMRHHLLSLSRRWHAFLNENVNTPFKVGHFTIKTVTGHYLPSSDLSKTVTYDSHHRIGPVRYCGLIRTTRWNPHSGDFTAAIQAYYKTIGICYIIDGMVKIEEVKHLHQFTMDLIDLYYAKSLSEKTS